MGSSDPMLTRLGRRAAEEEEALRIRAHDPGARERFVVAAAALRAKRAGRGGRVTSADGKRSRSFQVRVAFAIAAVVAGLVFVLARRPLRFTVGADDAAHAGLPGAWIATPRGRTTLVRFSDGTTFQVQPESKVRVAAVEVAGGRIVLENGRVHASVVHHFDSRWRVDSGPFEVLVTGTRFEVSWDLAAEELVVRLEEGAVTVSGPIVGDHFGLHAGQTLHVHRAEQRVELLDGDAPTTALPPIDAGAEQSRASASVAPAESASARAVALSVAPPHRAPSRTPPQAWRALVAAGDFKGALTAIDPTGFRLLCAEGSAADLRNLGDAARLSGDTVRAVEALTALRRRFPTDDQAAEAAFLLGLIAFRGRGADAESARWFATYLDERPRGRLAREALGRLVELLDKTGDHAKARDTARRYLHDFPSGPHAEMAKAILRE